MSVLIVDELAGFIDPAAEPFEILGPNDLDLEDFAAMSVRYGVAELCTALKPALIAHLLNGDEPVVLLDSDVRVFAPLQGLDEALKRHPFLLTPHLLRPLADDGRVPDELAILVAGSFNTGFAAGRESPEVRALLTWWCDRLRTGSRMEPSRGMVYEQRWADLLPGLFGEVGIWRDPGVNFGYWRVPPSRLEQDGESILVDGHPLRLFHFTGLDPCRPERLSRYENRITLDREPVLRALWEGYVEHLNAHGHPETSTWPYGFAATASGAPLGPELRAMWDRAQAAGAVVETPFTATGEESFLGWLAEPEPGVEGPPLSRYLQMLHAGDPGLRARFHDLDDRDREPFLAWAREQAERRPDEVPGLLQGREAVARRPGLRRLQPGEALGAERGEIVVCIPVYGARELFAECLTGVLAHTAPDVPILIADDASPDPAIEGFIESLAEAGRIGEHEVAYLRQPENRGFPANVNAALAVTAPADVVVLNSDCVVAAGWLEGMRRAAYSDANVATASALTNHGTILSVPERNRPHAGLPQDKLLGDAAAAVLEQSLRIYPRLPTAVGHCMYLRRQALDLVGDLDLAFSPGYGEEVDFSQRCVLHGLVHVAADEVFVLHHAGGSFSEDGEANPVQAAHDRIIDARYPYYQRAQAAAGAAEFGPLPRALAAARRSIRGLSVTIDARCLGPFMTGVQVHTLEVIRALSRTDRVGLRVIVSPDIGSHAQRELAGIGRVELIPHTAVHPGMEKTDIAHRPFQVSNTNDLLMLDCAGERAVITHQDLIAYRNPGYFAGYPQWERYQRLTRQALAAADSVVFISHHAAEDALREDLVDQDRVHIVYNGVDHAEPSAGETPRQPKGLEALGQQPMLLCLGTDFRHKNRVFAIRLLEALRARRSWDGMLVLAGPRVSEGSSAGEEASYLAPRPDLAEHVVVLPAVSEGEKDWLMERCSAVLYPTTYEGFGLMPFEAVSHDRPCLFASQTALAETLPSETATLVPWDPIASAERVQRLLGTPEASAEHVRAIRRAGGRFTWQSAGEMLVDVYWAAAASPARVSSRMALDLARVEAERAEAERKYAELWGSLTPEARLLVAPDGPLDARTTRSLAAVARRPLLRRVVFGPLQLAQRMRAGQQDSTGPEPATDPEAFALHFGSSNREHMREHAPQTEDERLIPDP